MSRRKIVATIGPATASAGAISRLVDAGMSVARLNGAHGTLEWHTKVIGLLREVVPNVPILFDIPGRKIRTATLAHEPAFSVGDTIVFTTELRHDGREKVPVNYPHLHEELQAGDVFFCDDGQLRFTVMVTDGPDIVCRAEVAGILRAAKGINVPEVKLRSPTVTDRDRSMLTFAREQGVDMVGISFVDSAEQVQTIRKLIGGRSPAIVAKVENRQAMLHLEEIVAETDVIMIDRGDLAVETMLIGVALAQKQILEVARRAACPVIVATEMLHSMIGSRVPTKAEVSDITNAVLDGASVLMLSGETAIGKFPEEAVAMMRGIVDLAADHVVARNATDSGTLLDIPDAVSRAVGVLCVKAPITKIIAVTVSGFAARMVASQMPSQPILAVSNDEGNARAMNFLPGVTGVWVDVPFRRQSVEHIPLCLHALWARQLLDVDDLVLVVTVGYPKSGNRLNLLEVHRVADLRETLQWE